MAFGTCVSKFLLSSNCRERCLTCSVLLNSLVSSPLEYLHQEEEENNGYLRIWMCGIGNDSGSPSPLSPSSNYDAGGRDKLCNASLSASHFIDFILLIVSGSGHPLLY